MRVAVVAECFTPSVNGVTNSVRRLLEHARSRGHEVIVMAPGPGPERVDHTPVVRVRSVGLTAYPDLRVGLPVGRLTEELRRFRPDVVYAAAPVVLGAAGLLAAKRLGIPRLAVFQTDLAGFARRYHLSAFDAPIWSWLRHVHRQANLTLAPSTAATWMLRSHGITPVALWPRGVDLDRFHPRHANRDLRRQLAPNDEVIVGFVGRLAREKQIERLRHVARRRDVRVVLVGDGPYRSHLERLMPQATFLGMRSGEELSALHATFDIFVHPGVDETFCQAVNESLASGCAVVAPAQGGPLDLVRHRDNGLLWTPGVPATLDAAVDELVASPLERTRLGRAARQSVEGRSWDAVMDELFERHLPALVPVATRRRRLRRAA
jgi:phosphatidylinositol alpha 1,6-mannosyltransferase